LALSVLAQRPSCSPAPLHRLARLTKCCTTPNIPAWAIGKRLVQVALAILAAAAAIAAPVQSAQLEQAVGRCGGEVNPTPLSIAQRLLYNGEYEQAAAVTREACGSADTLALCEVRTSALLLDLKRAFGESRNKQKALKACFACQQLMPVFLADTARGQDTARALLKEAPDDEAARFLLAKLDLNFVWLQLGVLGRKTGWHEYWEARSLLDKILIANPSHLRARVARAWIDYIVDTRVPFGTRWLLGGGNKKRGLLTMQSAASADGDFFARTEAAFALWDVQTREKRIADAVITAQRLACDFPDNPELQRFLAEARQN
jgi:hypothetical protein